MSTSPPANEPKQFEWSERIPVVIKRDPKDGTYKVSLAGVDLEMHLAADGVNVEFEDDGSGIPQPAITLKFSPGATELDLDAELIGYLRGKGDREQRRAIIRHHGADCPDPFACKGC